MAYDKYHDEWKDAPNSETPITGAALDHIEQGIADAHELGGSGGGAPADTVIWPGTGGVGSWPARPSLPSGFPATWKSLNDPAAPPPPGALPFDEWDRAPMAGY